MKVMGVPQEQRDRVEVLRVLIERLSAPDLTLTEAKLLRGRLSDLLEPQDPGVRHDPVATASALISSSDRGDGPRPDIWSPDPTMRVAG
jgi:hypothetical protein